MHDVIVFHNQSDQVADSLFGQLRKRGHSVLMVTADELAFAQWKHTIDDTGKSRTQIILPNRNIINSEKCKAAFNRITLLPMVQFVNETDRNYAEMEILAVYISFLKGINHLLINPVQTNYLITQEENELLLKKQAVDAGFPVTDFHFTSSPRWQHTPGLIPKAPKKNNFLSSYKKSPNLVWENKPVLFQEPFNKASKITVVGNALFGDYTNDYSTSSNKLAEYLGTPFFELQMVQTSGGLKLGAVHRFPVFGDPRVIGALVALIERKISGYS